MTRSSRQLLIVLLVAATPLVLGADSCFDDPEDTTCTAEEANACTAANGVFNDDTCGCCQAGPHQVHECEIGLEGTFDWQACECEANCDLTEAETCEGTQGVYNHVDCTCCHAGAHQIQSCEMGEGGTFNWQSCECEDTCNFNSDCEFGYECAGPCVESDCHEASPDGSMPALLCPNGFGCEYGDGVDWNHGNGYCVPNPTFPSISSSLSE